MLHAKEALFVVCVGLMLSVVGASGGCGGGGNGSTYGKGGSSGGGTSSGAGAGNLNLGDDGGLFGQMSTCMNGQGLACMVDTSCAANSQTTLTGKVYDPAGRNPLYDIIVFIPNDASTLPAITPGTHTCDTCDVSIGNYVAATITNYDGTFTLTGVPTGSAVPVTVQIGKWRRTVTVDIPNSCASNAANDGTLRLPRNRMEGDMPQMAVLTGGCDDLGCFLNGMGIDASEFSAPQGGGRLDVYQGVGENGIGGLLGGGGGGGGSAATLSNGTAGNCANASCPLWAGKSALEYYDIVLLSCECAENRQTKPAAGQQALHDWLGEGGKVFASHYQYTWFRDSPATDFQGVAQWGNQGNADAVTNFPANGTYDVDTSFPKGATFGQWLNLVGALEADGTPPTIKLNPVADSVVAVNSPTLRWIYGPTNSTDVKYMSFQTPIGGLAAPDGGEGGPSYCGKAVFTDLHTGGETESTVASIPNGCPGGALSPQQKALEFLFFDLSACVSNDMKAPPAPGPPPQ
jgi:hypothetical protein